MKTFISSFLLLTLILMSFTSCGDLLGTKIVKNPLNGSQFRADCELDTNEFTKILHENISSSIKCLATNLKLFMRLVESSKPGHLSRVALEQFLRKNRPDMKPEVLRALPAIFDINYLFIGEDPNFISGQNIDELIDLLLVFNSEAALNFKPTFENHDRNSYELHLRHRDRVTASAQVMSAAIQKVLNSHRSDKTRELSILGLMDAFSTPDNRAAVEKFKKVLFLKKVIVGGDPHVINHLEVGKLINKFDDFVGLALDLVRFEYLDYNVTKYPKQKFVYELLQRDVSQLNSIIEGVGIQDMDLLFTMDQAVEAVKTFVPASKFDIEKYRRLVTEAKIIAMGGIETEVRGIDLSHLLDHAKLILDQGVVFHKMYDYFKVQLASPTSVSLKFEDHVQNFPYNQDLLHEFIRIVSNYRFFKGTGETADYSTDWKRNPTAVGDIGLYEYVLKLVFKKHGSSSAGLYGKSMSKEQVQKLVHNFEPELIDLGIILPHRAESIANNISLLGSLFQFQSDENKLLDVNEGTEFTISLITSMGVGSDMIDYFHDKGCQFDRFDRVEPGCFRKNFIEGICSKYRGHYPKLFEYLNAPAVCDDSMNTEFNNAFLNRSIQAARSCMNYTDGNKEEIYYSQGDILALFMVIMHVETTILRWDENANNFMDASEVKSAYRIYSPALDAFVPKKISFLKEQIYRYLVKYEEVPDIKDFKSILKFLKFLVSFKWEANADRKTIASILYQVALQNAKLPSTSVKFQCDWLHDPENIPLNPVEPNALIFPVENEADYSYLLEPYKAFGL